MYNIEELNLKILSELKVIAEQLGVKDFKKLSKNELIYKILDEQAVKPTVSTSEKKQNSSSDEFSFDTTTLSMLGVSEAKKMTMIPLSPILI